MANKVNFGFWCAIVIVVIMTSMLYFSKATITGYLSRNIERHSVDLVIDKSQSFVISLSNNNVFSLRSLRLSGEVIGSGEVKVYIDNGFGVQRLIYANVKDESRIIDGAVSFVSENSDDDSLVFEKYRDIDYADFSENTKTIAGNFRRVCIETCDLNPSEFNNKQYEVLFYVSPGTKINLKEILYT